MPLISKTVTIVFPPILSLLNCYARYRQLRLFWLCDDTALFLRQLLIQELADHLLIFLHETFLQVIFGFLCNFLRIILNFRKTLVCSFNFCKFFARLVSSWPTSHFYALVDKTVPRDWVLNRSNLRDAWWVPLHHPSALGNWTELGHTLFSVRFWAADIMIEWAADILMTYLKSFLVNLMSQKDGCIPGKLVPEAPNFPIFLDLCDCHFVWLISAEVIRDLIDCALMLNFLAIKCF